MGAISWFSLRLLMGTFNHGGTAIRMALVMALMALSGAFYIILAQLLRLGEARQIWTTMRALLPGR
jgi:hypothetical protein